MLLLDNIHYRKLVSYVYVVAARLLIAIISTQRKHNDLPVNHCRRCDAGRSSRPRRRTIVSRPIPSRACARISSLVTCSRNCNASWRIPASCSPANASRCAQVNGSVSTLAAGLTHAFIRATRSRPANGRTRRYCRNEARRAAKTMRTCRTRRSKNEIRTDRSLLLNGRALCRSNELPRMISLPRRMEPRPQPRR
jgi:hypothetical protein